MSPWFSATAVLSELQQRWSLSPILAALLTMAVQLGFVVGAFFFALTSLPDILSLRYLMTGSAVVAALANAAMLLAPDAETAIVARFVLGAALAGVYPPALKLLSSWFVTKRGIALGIAIGALTVGSSLPHLLRAAWVLNWQLVVTAASVFTMSGGVLFFIFGHDGPHKFAPGKFDPRQIRAILANRAAVLANLGYFGHMWELYAMWTWFLSFSTVVLRGHGYGSAALPSLVTFGVIASGAIGCLLGGALSERFGRTAVTSGMMIVSGLCAAVIGFAVNGPIWCLVVVGTIWGMSIVGDSAQFSAIVTEVTAPSLIGTGLTLQVGLGFALTVVTIWVIPEVTALIGWRWAFLALVPGPVIGTGAMLWLRGLPEARLIAGGRR